MVIITRADLVEDDKSVVHSPKKKEKKKKNRSLLDVFLHFLFAVMWIHSSVHGRGLELDDL